MENVQEEELLQPVNIQEDPERWIAGVGDEMRLGFEKLAHITRGVSVFGSARPDPGDADYELGVQVGEKLSQYGFEVITGGGPGLMEAANRGAHQAGGVSVGIGIELPHEQGFNPYVNLSVQCQHFFTRKLMFVRYARAFVVLPGGFGTMDELFEALTLIQTQKIHDFPVILIGSDYWNPIIDWFQNHLVMRGYLHSADLNIFTLTDDLDDMVKIISAYSQPKGL